MQPDCIDNDPRVKIYQGENKTLHFRLSNPVTRDPLDISAATEIEVIFPTTVVPNLVKKMSLSQVTITVGPGGRFDVPLVPADTNLLDLGTTMTVEVRVTISGAITIIQIPAALNVLASMADS